MTGAHIPECKSSIQWELSCLYLPSLPDGVWYHLLISPFLALLLLPGFYLLVSIATPLHAVTHPSQGPQDPILGPPLIHGLSYHIQISLSRLSARRKHHSTIVHLHHNVTSIINLINQKWFSKRGPLPDLLSSQGTAVLYPAA